LGIKFDELSANEKLQHILDVNPVVKAKKLSPASVVEIERLTGRLLYQIRVITKLSNSEQSNKGKVKTHPNNLTKGKSKLISI
jgi:hypothetical protein